MLNRAFDAFVHAIWPESRFVYRTKSDYTNVGSHDKCLELDTTASRVTDLGLGQYEIDLYSKSNRAIYEYHASVQAEGTLNTQRVNTHYDFDWFMALPTENKVLERLFNDAYSVNDVRVLYFNSRHGLGKDLLLRMIRSEGKGIYTAEGCDLTGQFDAQVILESQKGLNGLPTYAFQLSNYRCSVLPCPGCAVCNGKLATAPLGQFLNSNLGQPHQFTGGVIEMPSNVVPVMLTPGSNYLPSKSALMNKNLQALNNSKPMNPKSPKDVTEILQFLEREIDVKIGMLSSQNIFLHRVTIYDREDWEEKLRGELDLLRRRLGDKVGVIGDMRITNLDEIDYPEASPLHGSKPTTAVGRKFSVHAAYRMDYQAIKLTIMALVKA